MSRKRIHVCRCCWSAGNFKSDSKAPDRVIHELCGAEYTREEWLQLPTIEVPASIEELTAKILELQKLVEG